MSAYSFALRAFIGLYLAVVTLSVGSQEAQSVAASVPVLPEGALVSASGSSDPDVYIVNAHGYKRLFLNPVIFSFYGHLGGFDNVRMVAPSVRDAFVTSGLFRNCETGDQKVWAVQSTGEDTAVLHHVNVSGADAVMQDPDFFKKVFCINSNEEAWYTKSSHAYTHLSQVPVYRRVPDGCFYQNVQCIQAPCDPVLVCPHVAPTPPPVTPPSVSSDGPVIAGCPVFPATNPWNTDISAYPVHANSGTYISSIGASGRLHPDFGGNGEYGIPYITVSSLGQAGVPVAFEYDDESDAGPYPIPTTAPIEGGASSTGDRHVIAVDSATCTLYELYSAYPSASGWRAGSGAKFDLRSNTLRPDYWTSADAAGLPILPGLVRYDEVAAGAIRHALRFTVSNTQKAFIHPATHYASSSTSASRPPMGLRLRLKASYDTSRFTGQSRVIVEALKRYGMIVADNGSNWFITGASDTRWDDDDLRQLKSVPGSAFEAVETGPIIK